MNLKDKRNYERHSMKLHAKLSADSFVSCGLLSDVSENGLFIKSNRDFTMGDTIDIEVFMPDNNNSLLKGVIRRKIEPADSHRKYGLGIEVIEKDMVYRDLLRNFKVPTKTPPQTPKGIVDQ
jgi:hypothetical protein